MFTIAIINITYMRVCMICIYIYIHLQRERERARERERERETRADLVGLPHAGESMKVFHNIIYIYI